MTEVMWRNVFGHAIYQSVVIFVIIFFGSALFGIKDYETLCLKETESGDCTLFNPYFTNELYFNREAENFWSSSHMVGLTKQDFDQDLLEQFNCDYNKQIDSKFNCTTDLKEENWILPIKQAKGSMTQKLLHYTYIF
jgi:hypothetical protein